MCYFLAELPESMSLEFQCGVQIQLGFAAEFSNVMIIYTQIIKKPPEITACRAHITDFPLVSASCCCLMILLHWSWKFSAPPISSCILYNKMGLKL